MCMLTSILYDSQVYTNLMYTDEYEKLITCIFFMFLNKTCQMITSLAVQVFDSKIAIS